MSESLADQYCKDMIETLRNNVAEEKKRRAATVPRMQERLSAACVDAAREIDAENPVVVEELADIIYKHIRIALIGPDPVNSETVPTESAKPQESWRTEMLGNDVDYWINEDELPDGYPYDAMFPLSRLGIDGRGGCRIFPKLIEEREQRINELESALGKIALYGSDKKATSLAIETINNGYKTVDK